MGGWQLNNILAFRSGPPFTVTASGTPLNSPEHHADPADQVKDDVEIFGGVGRGNAYFDPFAFAPVPSTEPRFGTAGFNSMGDQAGHSGTSELFRQIALAGRASVQMRVEAFNVTNRPQFATRARTDRACS